MTPLRATEANWSGLRFSPDGTRLAMSIGGGADQPAIFVYDIAGSTMRQLTFNRDGDTWPVWSEDGRRIAFASIRPPGPAALYWVAADGGSEPQALAATDPRGSSFPGSWHPSGKFLAYHVGAGASPAIMILPVEAGTEQGVKPGKPYPFLAEGTRATTPAFSPDGRWLAYQSVESELRGEIYVRPFPAGGGQWKVSSDGGAVPMWSRTRRELLYRTPDDRIMVASYTVNGDSFKHDAPRLWTERPIGSRRSLFNREIDLHPDGERIAASVAAADTPGRGHQDRLVFVFNFFEQLRRVAPSSR